MPKLSCRCCRADMQTATVGGISRWISATRGSVSAKGRIISPATCIADPTADESNAEIGVGLLIGGELDDTVGELLRILSFYPVDHLNLPVPMASLAHTSISCWSVARTLAACSGIRTAANTSPSTPWAAAALGRLALSRGVRGAYKCRRCWVFAIFEIVLAPRRCGERGGVSGASYY